MGRKTKPAQDRIALLKKVPEGSERIKVKDEFGKARYKDISELADKDFILTKADGSPIVMKKKPGRPQAITFDPANEQVKRQMERKAASLEADILLRKIREEPESADVLHMVMVGLGEEAASLAFERSEAERNGKETSQLSLRRVNALKAQCDTWLKRKDQVQARGVDLGSPGFKTVFRFIVETMQEAMLSSHCRPEMIETVFSKFSKVVSNDTWEAEAKARMKQSV